MSEMSSHPLASIDPDERVPAMILFGRSKAGKPLAGWFSERERSQAVTAIAKVRFDLLFVSRLEEADWQGTPEGKFDHKNRVVLSPVDESLHERLTDLLKSVEPSADPRSGSEPDHDLNQSADVSCRHEPAEEFDAAASNANPSIAQNDPWEGLKVGNLVAAPELQRNGAINGYWPAMVRLVHADGDLTLAWRDEPASYPTFRRPRRSVALLAPALTTR